MICHMRHGSSPRLMALQPICIPNPRASPAGSISRRPYQKAVGKCEGFGAVTDLGQVRGLELSAVGGFTLNGEEPETNYRCSRYGLRERRAGKASYRKTIAAGFT